MTDDDSHPLLFRAPPSRRWASHVWLALVVLLSGAPAAYLATTGGGAVYRANGVLRVDPAETTELVALLRSRAVLDAVVERERLYLRTPGAFAQAFEDLAGLSVRVEPEGLVFVSLEGSDAERTTALLGALMQTHVETAHELRAARARQLLELQRERLDDLERDFEEAEAVTHALRAERLALEVWSRMEALEGEIERTPPPVRILEPATLSERRNADGRLPLLLAMLLACVGAAAGGTWLSARRASAGGATGVEDREDLLPLLAIVASGVLAIVATLLLGA